MVMLMVKVDTSTLVLQKCLTHEIVELSPTETFLERVSIQRARSEFGKQ